MGGTQGDTVTREGSPSPRADLWAYAYQIVPPQNKSRLRTIKAILDDEHLAARRGSRTWGGRLVRSPHVTRILIVSDTLEQSREVTQRLEAALKLLKVDFSVTEPVALPAHTAPPLP